MQGKMAGAPMVLAGSSVFKSIFTHFPAKCRYSFAYGSGVFQQLGQSKGKMIDMIFVVDDPVEWHSENLKQNFSHYSGLRRFGPRWISHIQEKMACGVYYNPFVSVEGQLIKYGVISTKSLEDDLLKWTHLYLAGRLHKPVLEILPDFSGAGHITKLIDKNRDAALRAALLLNPRSLRKTDLYYTITELSYMGDFRMAIGEHPDKVRNIVTPMVPQFDHIYYPLIQKLEPFVKIDKHGVVTQDVSANGILYQLMGLPHPIQRSLARRIHRDPKLNDIEDAMLELAHLPHVARYLRKSIAEVVWGSSILQTIQGILSAGVTRSIKYGWEKISKKLKADKEKSQQAEPRALLSTTNSIEVVPSPANTAVKPPMTVEEPRSKPSVSSSERVLPVVPPTVHPVKSKAPGSADTKNTRSDNLVENVKINNFVKAAPDKKAMKP